MMSLIQYDDFAPDALAVRDEVINGSFSTETGPDGGEYTGIAQHEVPEWHSRIEFILKRRIIPKLSFFRLNLEGELPHSWVHSDKICAQFASLLYLNLPHQCYGGTAFWKHTGLGIDQMPDKEGIEKSGFSPTWFNSMMNKEWKDLTFWEQSGFCAMKWNRFLTYPTAMFHSRYPFGGFGSGPKDGRLIWVCFYHIA